MIYSSALGSNDMVYGRGAIEKANYISAGFSMMKTTKRLFRFLYLYGGAEIEFGFSPGSQINFWEYTYDYKKDSVLQMNEFKIKGKARFLPFFSALLGAEIRPIQAIGLNLEVRSGVGAHFVVNENPVGVSRTVLVAGISLYFPWLKKANHN